MNNKDLINQYVNIGHRLNEYQVNKLGPNNLKSYLRTRILSIRNSPYSDELLSYEFARMDNNQKDDYINSIKSGNIDDAVMTLNGRAKNDNFVTRLIDLRPAKDITANLQYILNNSHSPISVVSHALKTHGPILNYSYNMGLVLNKFDSNDAKLQFCKNYLKLLSENLDEKMTTVNSPIIGMVSNLSSIYCSSIAKYFIMLNLTKPDGNKVDDKTFWALVNNTSDDTFIDVTNFMKRHLELEPIQSDFIETETNQINKT